jgi:PAT family beta-lactamase induction signal transducer AmpG
MTNNTKNWLQNPRLLAIFFLGFASGLPLALVGSTLQAWFTEASVDLVTIGALSLLGIPYTLKFLWAPLMDQYGLSRLGKRRSWILLTQFGLVIALLVLAQLDPGSNASVMGMIALLIAFFSASQDISVDAYRTDVLLPTERGLGAAYYIFAYRIAMLVAGGLALICADYVGWKLTYEIMAALILLSMLPTFLAPAEEQVLLPSNNIFTTMKQSLGELLSRDKIVFLLLLIVFYKFGDALALSLMTNFLLHGLGFTLTEVGFAFKLVGFVATMFGAFVAGAILTRCNIFYGLLWFGFAQTFSNLLFVALAMVGKNFTFMAMSLFVENFCSGLSTAALMAFLMSLCNHRYTASQYALLSAIASLGRVFLGPMAGFMVENMGWVQFYIWSFVLCFPGLVFLVLLKEKVVNNEPILAD